MVKNSFTLFETLISLILISVIIVGFSKTSNYDNLDEEFMLLNKLENSFNTNSYNSSFSNTSKTIKIIKNENLEETISVQQIKYSQEKIELVKYRLNR